MLEKLEVKRRQNSLDKLKEKEKVPGEEIGTNHMQSIFKLNHRGTSKESMITAKSSNVAKVGPSSMQNILEGL